ERVERVSVPVDRTMVAPREAAAVAELGIAIRATAAAEEFDGSRSVAGHVHLVQRPVAIEVEKVGESAADPRAHGDAPALVALRLEAAVADLHVVAGHADTVDEEVAPRPPGQEVAPGA